MSKSAFTAPVEQVTRRRHRRRIGWAAAILLTSLPLIAANQPAADTPTPPADAAGAPVIDPATAAMLTRLAELRGGLADEDLPTRKQAQAQLRLDLDRMLETIFRVPPDEDTPDERKLLVLLALQTQAKLQYEQYLLKIPAAHRNAVDAMLKKSGGDDFLSFFSAATPQQIEWLDKLVAAKPDPAALAVFFCSLLPEKNPELVTHVLTAARATAPTVNGEQRVPEDYLEPLGDLLKKGYIGLYLDDGNNGLNPMHMRMPGGNDIVQQIQAWHTAALDLLSAVPGDRADRLLVDLLDSFANPYQNALQMRMGNQAGNVVLDLANRLVKRKIQAAFPALVKCAQAHPLMQMGASINGSPTLYSSTADFFVYSGCRMLDPKLPERGFGRFGGMDWKSNAERLTFYDNFLAAWRAVAKDTHREGYDTYEKWYQQTRPQLVNAVDMENKQLEQRQKNQPDVVEEIPAD